MADFKIAYEITKEWEGGFANVPGDLGGITYAGISRKYHPDWPGWRIVDAHKPLKWNEKIDDPCLNQLVEDFYLETQWTPIKGDQIESQKLANFLYDYHVHSGTRAIKSLQKVLNFPLKQIDGKVGTYTLGKMNERPEYALEKLKTERRAFLTQLSKRPGQAKFKDGWLRRVDSF